MYYHIVLSYICFIVGENPENNDVEEGPSSAMDAPFVQAGYATFTMPQFSLLTDPSAMAAPYIPGGYTSLLMGVDQDASMQTAVRKLHFDGVQNHESM